jgi:hypothetical protein
VIVRRYNQTSDVSVPVGTFPISVPARAGRGEAAPWDEVATPDSWHWSASGCSLGGVDADELGHLNHHPSIRFTELDPMK